MFYALGLTNVEQFKDKYEYEFDKVLDYSDIKIFYAIRQYETTETLKNELSMHGANDIANIIGSMDTNKCLVLSKNYDYTVLNIDEPSGETYDKYSYGQKESESVIEKIKNKDIKLKINYLDEFKERVNKKQETVKPKVEEKTLNLQPELTKEEKEYIANLLKEKQEQDERKLAFRNNDFVYEEDDEFADGDVDNDKTLVRSLTNMYDKEDYITEGYESDYDKDKEEAARRYKETTDKQTALRSKEEIDASLEKLNLIQNNYVKVVEEEKMKTTHALYEQMKNLK